MLSITSPTPALAAPLPGAIAIRAMTPRAGFRDILFAGALALFAGALVHAEEAFQDWVPEVLSMPADVELLSERAIGSSVRMFSIATETAAEPLFAEWEQALRDNGFAIDRQPAEAIDRAIEFSGPGIANAKIVEAPVTDDGRTVIDFDATLN
jgi:hypothetical protein